MVKLSTSCLLPRQPETKCCQKRLELVETVWSFLSTLLLPIMLSRQAFALVFYWIVEVFDRSRHRHISDKVRVSPTFFASIIPTNILRTSFTHYEKWSSIAIDLTRTRTSSTPLQPPLTSFTRSAILVLPQAQKITGGKLAGFEKNRLKDKIFRIQRFSETKFPI